MILAMCTLLVFGLSCNTSKPTTYQLTTIIEGQGNVSPSSGAFVSGSMLTLTASPASGWEFDHWGGNSNGSENITRITMDSDKTVYAYFTVTPIAPNVKIQSVTLPSNVKASTEVIYPTTFRLVNTESVDITGTWQAYSSVSGNYDSGTVTIPKNSYLDITRNYIYTNVGPVTITYTIYYNGVQIDTWSGTMNILP